MSKQAVAYYRVSTNKQSAKGHGLEAQRYAVNVFCVMNDMEIAGCFTDVESGSVDNRCGLHEALKLAKSLNAPVVVKSLCRLSRDVHFISGLMKHDVAFVVTELPEATPFMLHVYAAIHEESRRAIGRRTSAALLAASRRGVKLGAAQEKTRQAVIKAQRARGEETWTRLLPHLTDIFTFAKLNDEAASLSYVARKLNEAEVLTARGGSWTRNSVARFVRRYKEAC